MGYEGMREVKGANENPLLCMVPKPLECGLFYTISLAQSLVQPHGFSPVHPVMTLTTSRSIPIGVMVNRRNDVLGYRVSEGRKICCY